MIKRQIKMAAVLLLSIFMLTGCWSHKELTDIAFVSAIGVDRLENGKYLVTYQIVNSLNIPNGMQLGGGQGPPVTIYQATGRTVQEAFRNGGQEISRRLYFSHANVLMVGEETAKEGIYPVLDVLDRYKEFRNTATFVIARNCKAEDILKVLTPIDRVPANKINKTLEYAQEGSGGRLKISMSDLISDFTTEGKEAAVGSIKLIGDPEKGKMQDSLNQTALSAYLMSSAIGIIKNGKLIGWVDGNKARVITWLLKKTNITSLTLDWNHHPDAVDIRTIKTNVDIKPVMKNGKPEMNIDITFQGQLYEVDVPMKVMDMKMIGRLQKAYEKKAEQQIYEGIRYMQQEKCDVFGFGQMIHQQYPKQWKKMKNHWNEKGFANLKVNVHSNVIISNSELRTDPFHSNLK
ncbi:Ger(x)C family spore germination protein [Weizmannia acidilactici]|uniref:Ger(x)C family spore germination protein n=1 Tax=Weizmannia acidilactici TaxID=2607726 RepID=UPI00124EACA4|nr:Ger(x)C family spore germination protein [Weizmannia acidilactici]GER73142.1 spore germination protein KC [Weizmannia acidilactici]